MMNRQLYRMPWVIATVVAGMGCAAQMEDTSSEAEQTKQLVRKSNPSLSEEQRHHLDQRARGILGKVRTLFFRDAFARARPSFSKDIYDERIVSLTYVVDAGDGKRRTAIVRLSPVNRAFVDGELTLMWPDDNAPPRIMHFKLFEDGGVAEIQALSTGAAFSSCEQCLAWSASVYKFVLELIASGVGYGPASFACAKALAASAPTVIGVKFVAKACTVVLLAIQAWILHLPLQGAAQFVANLTCERLTPFCEERDEVSCDGLVPNFSARRDGYYKVPYVNFRRNITRLWGDQSFELELWTHDRRTNHRTLHTSRGILMKRDRGFLGTLGAGVGQGLTWRNKEKNIEIFKFPWDERGLWLNHRPTPGAGHFEVHYARLQCL